MKLSEFDFFIPRELIAQRPVKIRDRARLMIVDRQSGNIEEGEFRDIVSFLRPSDLMVLNNTKVFPARLFGEKAETGGKIEALLINPTQKDLWICLIKGRIRAGQRLFFAQKTLLGTVIRKEAAGKWLVRFEWDGDFFEILQKHGHMPLPPYIKRASIHPEDVKRYQTVFARHLGAVAAPTAGLHFTENLIKKIRKKGIEIAFVTLHVGPGTFKPVMEEEIENHIMDKEAYYLDPKDLTMIDLAKKTGKRIVAVGTTTTRVLETIYLNELKDRNLKESSLEGITDLFITPGFHFNAIDALITNFHLPRSTLIMLVCAFAGYDLIMKAYSMAVKKGFRFYSYGDAMFII